MLLCFTYFTVFLHVLGAGCDRFEDDADVLRQRLVQALVAPVVMEGAQKCDEQRNTQTERTSRKPSSTDTVHLVDVAQLSLAQRVLVQLNGVGVFGVGYQVGVLARATNVVCSISFCSAEPTPSD